MQDLLATNLIPPALGPQYTTYPHLPQFVRVEFAPVAVTSGGYQVYPAVVQQWDGSEFRDREQVFIIGENNEALSPGKYLARLIGVWPPNDPGGLPLFATFCCVGGGSLSSSSSPSH